MENFWPFWPFSMVHIDSQGKDIIKFPHRCCPYKTKSSILAFTEKEEKRYPCLGELWNSTFIVYQLPHSNFHYFHYQYQSRLYIYWNHFCSFPFLAFVCVCVYAILLTYSSIILGKTLYSYFPHHVFIFLPTSYSQFSRKVLSVHLVCSSLIFLREVGHLLLSFGITFETRKLVTEFR